MEKRGAVSVKQDSENIQNSVIKIANEQYIDFLGSLLFPFIESYRVAITFLKEMHAPNTFEQSILEKQVQQLADLMYDEGYLNYYECCSLETIGNALQMYASYGILDLQITASNQKFFRISSEKEPISKMHQLFETLELFKPVRGSNISLINIEEEVKKIQMKPKRQLAKL